MNRLFRAIVVDDEPAARRLMRNLLQEHKDVIEVIEEAGNGKEAIEKIDKEKPDVVFLDIQMPDLTGFEVLEKLSVQPNIIFTTAYEQYAIKAFESFSIDYLLKPVKEERLAKAIDKLQQFGQADTSINLTELQEMISKLQTPKKSTAMSIKTGDRISLIRFEQISYMEAQDKYVYIHTIDGKKHITDQSLSALIEKLPDQFYRIQKSYIINKDRIKEMHRHFNGRYLFTMDDAESSRLTSGRTYHEAIKAEFDL
ncbi:MAG: response regulator transcription factor [Chitinophagaceae bacterium]|nr:response regulator transcription factor [Chitinophagaceae bacterium]MCB9055948.1 response regulator transcription factor [Chitinophagales bacterium]